MNKFVTALKEDKNGVRKTVLITTAIGLGVIATAVVLSKMKDNSTDVILVTTESVDAIADVASE